MPGKDTSKISFLGRERRQTHGDEWALEMMEADDKSVLMRQDILVAALGTPADLKHIEFRSQVWQIIA